MRIALLLILLLPLCTLAAPAAKPAAKAPPAKAAARSDKVQRSQRGNLVIENIPDIPPALAELTNQYQQARSASLQGWLDDGVLITTRFGDTAQVHRVAFP